MTDRLQRPTSLLLLGALCALPPLSIDMALPAAIQTQNDLGGGPLAMGLTLSLFMAGFALAPIAYGAVSDRLGRKAPLILGLLLFTLGGLGCAFASSVDMLLIARVVQGMGAGVGPTLAFAASRDRLQGTAMHRRLAALGMLLGIAPVIAPSLGAAILSLSDWRAIYAVLTALGAILVLWVSFGFEETWPAERRSNAAAPSGRRLFARIFSRIPLQNGAIRGLSAGSMFAYVAGSPLLFVGAYGVSSHIYAGLFACTALGIVAGSAVSGALGKRLGGRHLIGGGLILATGAPAVALALILLGGPSLQSITICLVTATFGYGLITPAATQAALEPMGDLAGLASALLNTFQMACMALASLLVAATSDVAGIVAAPAVMVLFSAASLLAFLSRGAGTE
ncbi:Bcr/CflA family efflux MFS transporter [Brevundimonas sp.]|uniref:Bcr/CflA family efflux MFS transporter n=1 Tax=Brevundimonas sp. TaxID=1871086 RepID=UPI001A316647|nr:Bcr/CflA family efflux MFS transporter [Brevundimonas sp.]MBJ7483670.1 Bcr/CflA family efflux MFS transporter [Brevundimonas sp.]